MILESEFTNKVSFHIRNIVSKCVNYANNESLITHIYIYVSYEWVIFFDWIYRIDKELIERHKINRIIKTVDVSVEKQRIVNLYCNSQLSKIKQLFIDESEKLPTQIKIRYSLSEDKIDFELNYDEHHNDELFIGDHDVSEKWYEELKREINIP